MDKEKIILAGVIDLTKEPVETYVKPITDNVWQDWAFWLEICGFVAYKALKYKQDKGEWETDESIAEYAKQYIKKCLNDYTIKK